MRYTNDKKPDFKIEVDTFELLDLLKELKHYRADVQSVRHGYWKEEEPRVLKCSVCGEYAPMNYLGQNCIDSRYCPWCGTKMDSNAE